MPQSLGALGGKPNNAYYFIGFLGKERGMASKCRVRGGLGRRFSWETEQFLEGILARPRDATSGQPLLLVRIYQSSFDAPNSLPLVIVILGLLSYL